MATILTICRHCGDVEVTLDDLSVRVWVNTDHGEYTLHCPTCESSTVWPADSATIDVLAAVGAALDRVPRRPGAVAPGSGHRPRAKNGPTRSARPRRPPFGRRPPHR